MGGAHQRDPANTAHKLLTVTCAPHLIGFLLHWLHFLFTFKRHRTRLHSMSCQSALHVLFVPAVPAPDGALDNCSADFKLIPIRTHTKHPTASASLCPRRELVGEDRKLYRNDEAWARDLSSEAGSDRH